MEPEKVSSQLTKIPTSELYKDVELTKEEEQLALLEARQKKAARLHTQEYMKRLEKRPVYPVYKAETLLEQVRAIPGFVVDEFNESIIIDLCLYFVRDPRCPLDFKKGLLLYGPVGCGKTTLMHFFRHNQTNSFALLPVREIADAYQKGSNEAIAPFKMKLPSSDIDKTFGQQFIGACFDDLGTEVDKKHFGNESNVMAEILLSRYDRFKNPEQHERDKWGKTHITTNLTTDQLEERYGKRVRSRMREMFNPIVFPKQAPDRRK